MWRCANRAYYAAYHVCVAVCVSHGDADKFPPEWNNPTHDQLPDLLKNNGGFTVSERETIKKHLNSLRSAREDADYRVGRTVERSRARQLIFECEAVFRVVGVSIDKGELL